MNSDLLQLLLGAPPARMQHKHPFLRPCLFVLAMASAVPSFAATLTVTNTNDSGAGSLRNAIATANSGDTITFNLPNPSTITLTSTLSICNSQTLTITGPGASLLAISGNSAVQVFSICSGANVTLSGLMIEKGLTNALGGGIENHGMLAVSNSTLTGNSAGDAGGGIYNNGTLTLTKSTLSGNSTTGTCTGGQGGGINNYAGTATIADSTLTGNSAGCSGGGIENIAVLTVTNSTLSGNSAGSYGGGIDNENSSAILTLTNSTIAGNSANSGGGITNFAQAILKSTLFANSTTGGNCNLGNPLTSLGYNLADDNTCGFSATDGASGDEQVSSAGLDPKGLQNSGGSTQTIALLSTSPAVDHIPAANCTDTSGKPVTTDQRGVSRPQGKGCDVGAFELVQTVAFESFHASLAIDDGKHPGFVLTSTFTLGSASTGLNPATEALTLQIANYTLTLPAGAFHQLWKAANAPYAYEGTVNGATVLLGLVPLGNNTFAFDAAGSPVTFPGIKNPVTVTLTFGKDTGTTSVKALITSH